MTELVWEEPGAGRGSVRNWDGVAEQLREHAGRWAVVAEDAFPAIAQNIKRGRIRAMRPAGTFEAKVRGLDSDTGRAAKIYARYVGEGNTND